MKKARCVVSATGYFSNPHSPQDFVNDNSIKILHFADYKSLQQLESLGFKKNCRILIVGDRVSVGQLLVEFFHGGYDIGISTRGVIETRMSGLLGWIKENLYYVKEYLGFLINPNMKGESSALMDGGETKKILTSEKIRFHLPIKEIHSGSVTFLDGKKESYDLIVMATGFKLYVDHLKDLIETATPLLAQLERGCHKYVKGLFFLGVDNMITFKSRYLRGIVSDSKIITKKINNFLKIS